MAAWRLGPVLAFLVSSALAHCEQAQNDHLIVPCERIGPIELGRAAADLTRIKGDPTQTSRGPTGGVSVYTWKNDLSVYIKSDGSYVTQISIAGGAITNDGTPEVEAHRALYAPHE